jgi:replicative DNA helicase
MLLAVSDQDLPGHVFLSYVQEDVRAVDNLQRVLEAAGIRVWRDKNSLWPGQDWRSEIRNAITGGALAFIACFSCNSASREVSYQREELMLAFEQLRVRRPDGLWLIPVRLDDCVIPDLEIGGGRTLTSIQRIDLFGDDDREGVARLVATVLRILSRGSTALETSASEASSTAGPRSRLQALTDVRDITTDSDDLRAYSHKAEAVTPFAVGLAELLPGVLSEIEALGTPSQVRSLRIPTGHRELDALFGGWPKGALIAVSGRPSSGKSALLLGFCRAAAIKYRIPSIFVSTEMNDKEIQIRLLSAEGRVSYQAIRTAKLNEEDWSRLAGTLAAIADAPISICPCTAFDFESLEREAAESARKSGLRLLVMDGLESAASDRTKGALTTELRLQKLKMLAERLAISVIVSVPANSSTNVFRPVEMNDVRDRGAVERVADVVILIERPDQYDHESPRAGEADFMIVKNRYGPSCTVSVAYQGHYSRFVDMWIPDFATTFPVSLNSKIGYVAD